MPGSGLQVGNRFAGQDLTKLHVAGFGGEVDDAAEIGTGRKVDQNLHEKTVELRFRERIRAFHLDGILGGHDKEGRLERIGIGAAGDGALLHGFEQGGLSFGRGAIDLVREHEVGKNGTGLEAKSFVAVLVVHDDAADDVAGHQVGGELDAGVLEGKNARQSSQQGGFAKTRDAFKENVAAGDEANENTFDDFVLTDDSAANFVAHAGKISGCALDRGWSGAQNFCHCNLF